MQAFSPENS